LNNAARRLETVPDAAPLLELWRMQSEMNRVFSGFSAAAAQIFRQSTAGLAKTAWSQPANY
jgi:hypothetical protein